MHVLQWRRWAPQALIDFREATRFEMATAWGRLRQRPYHAPEFDYLQVGSGERRYPNFLNATHFIEPFGDYCLDIRYPLPFADGRWRGIYAHHVVEHIRYHEALDFFRECHRVLQSRGILRVVVPDAERFVRAYAEPADRRLDVLRALVPTAHLDSVDPSSAMGFVSYTLHSHPLNPHRSGWDAETMCGALKLAGFSEVAVEECNQSSDSNLRGLDNPSWAAHSLYVEACRE